MDVIRRKIATAEGDPPGHRQGFLAARRQATYELLERGELGNRASRWIIDFIVFVVLINLAAVTLQSIPAYAQSYAALFDIIEFVTLVVLTVEYFFRLWVSVEHPLYRHLPPLWARLRYAVSAGAMVDLVAVLPFWLAFVFPAEFRMLLVLRAIRLLKLGRYSPAMRSLLDVLYAERRALVGCFLILLSTALLLATLMHMLEREVQPEKFGTIPEAMWWAIVTLGTIGYGDVVPITVLGRIVAAGAIFLGVVMIALPVGIIATAFANDIHRRDFVVTWAMVARVPLFAGLDAHQIAEIMKLLRAQNVETGTIIARRGEPAHSMYFIAAGEVEIRVKDEIIRLGSGHFFGEVAVLRKARRSASAVALTRTSLLVLDASDVHTLMDREPKIAERVRRMAHEHRARHQLESAGDILVEELEDAEEDKNNVSA